jgi:RNA polymerase sigma-70 factor (sigma-E family)
VTAINQEFEAFVHTRGSALLRFAYVLTRDAALAEDLVQEAILKVYKQWGKVAVAEHPEAYVKRIVVNEFISWRRRRRNAEVPGEVPDLIGDAAVESIVAERDWIWRAMADLSPRQRAALVLRFYEDLSEEEIARILGCAGGTVRSLTTRALDALRTHPQLSRAARPAISRGDA